MRIGDRLRITIGSCIAALISAAWAAAADTQTSGNSLDGLLWLREVDGRGIAHLAVDPTRLAALARGQSARFMIPVDDSQRLELVVQRFEVLTPDARFIRAQKDGRAVLVAPPKVVLLRGGIAGEHGSRAFIAIRESDRGGSGSITRADGSVLKIATDWSADGRVLGLAIGAPQQASVGDASDAAVPCGTDTTGWRPAVNPNLGAGGTTNPAAAGPQALVVAIECDQSYSRLFSTPDADLAYAIELAGAVSDVYLREINFRVAVAQVRTHPFGGEGFSADDLGGFRTWWPTTTPPPGIQIVHMLSGRRDLGYGGVAYLVNACSGVAFGISGFLLGDFPTSVGEPNLGNWDVVVMSHEIGHNLGSPHTWDYSPPIDQCFQGVEERGTIMSYCHTRPGGLLNTDIRMHAVVAAEIAASNAAGACLWRDCNGNNINDAIDIAGGTPDANADGIPDSCQDCNANGILDPAEIAATGGPGGAMDINSNGVPDSCEDDCNLNGLPDQWEIDQGQQQDVDGDGRPDTCEADCNANGSADFIDIRAGTSLDIDRNSTPDDCQDCNSNGVVDWIDMDRQFNWFIGQSASSTGVREYHQASGVGVRELLPGGGGLIDQAYDLCFGPDRQLYVASFANSQIVRINVDSGAASVFVAPGAGGLGSPAALTFGPDGHLYVSNQATNSVLRFNGSTGAPMGEFVASGGGGLTTPWGMAFDSTGRLWIVCGDDRVRRYSAVGLPDPISVIVPSSALDSPRDLVFLPGGEFLVTNRTATGGGWISRFSATGAYLGRWNDIYPLTSPWGITLGPRGNVFAARAAGDVRIIEYDRLSGRYVRSFIRGDLGLAAPTAFAIRPASPNDVNGNGRLDACENLACIGDVTGNHAVNINDLVQVIIHWNENSALAGPADINHDNIVNMDDLVIVISHWGICP